MKAAQCHHLRAAVLFIEEFQEAGVRLEGLLGSTTVSDVVEALRYFVTVRACLFSVFSVLCSCCCQFRDSIANTFAYLCFVSFFLFFGRTAVGTT